jgi:16S rRNA (cytidine1402-2'-O)-methyltransferase
LSELAERFAEGARGECTLVVEGVSEIAAVLSEDELDAAIRARVVEGESPRQISDQLAKSSGLPKREIYARVVALKS